MMFFNFRTLAVALVAATAAGGAATWNAQAAPPAAPQVSSLLRAFKIVQKDGKEALADASTVKPGDVIEYRVDYTNRGASDVTSLKATLPIPVGMSFIGQTAVPAGAEASTDKVTFVAMPIKRVVKAADGTNRTVMVPLSEYRALRWNIGTLGAGKSALVAARVRVVSSAAKVTR